MNTLRREEYPLAPTEDAPKNAIIVRNLRTGIEQTYLSDDPIGCLVRSWAMERGVAGETNEMLKERFGPLVQHAQSHYFLGDWGVLKRSPGAEPTPIRDSLSSAVRSLVERAEAAGSTPPPDVAARLEEYL